MIEQNIRDIPMKRMGTEAEVSAAIVFLDVYKRQLQHRLFLVADLLAQYALA